MKTISKKKLKEIIKSIIEDYNEQIDYEISMIQHMPKDLCIRREELQRLIKTLNL